MRKTETVRTFDVPLHEIESCWYDTNGWPEWVEGLDRIKSVKGDWPHPGAVVTWESSPAGRGSVNEKVVGYEPGAGQTVEVADASIVGTQSVVFTPASNSVEVSLRIEYQILNRSILTPILDFLFVKRAMRRSLETTLTQFGAHLDAVRSEA